jgi:hypothetical protein
MRRKENRPENERSYVGRWSRPYPCNESESESNNIDYNYDCCDSWDNQVCCGYYNPCNNKRNKFDKCENKINICNKVTINQTANAQGGEGGDGGDAESGDVTGGSAAAASGLIAVAANVTEPDIRIPLSDDLKQQEENIEPLQTDGGTTAAGGSATGGDSQGGEGGRGGDGGTATNEATVAIENVIVISCNGDGPSHALTLGTNNRKLDIEVNENGETLVNGQKMQEESLPDGTKVLIFRSSTSEKK